MEKWRQRQVGLRHEGPSGSRGAQPPERSLVDSFSSFQSDSFLVQRVHTCMMKKSGNVHTQRHGGKQPNTLD